MHAPNLEDAPERLQQWLQARQVHGFIKLRAEEFSSLPAGQHFWHINAAPCSHRPHERYALVCMAQPSAGQRQRPLLDLSRTLLVRCEAVVELSSCQEVTEDQLSRLIGACSNHVELVAMLHRRYQHTKGWTRLTAAQLPVVLSALRLAA